MSGPHLASAALLALTALTVVINPPRDRLSRVSGALAHRWLGGRPGPPDRIRPGISDRPDLSDRPGTHPPGRRTRLDATIRTRLAGVVIGAVVALALGGWSGALVGALAGFGGCHVLRRAAVGPDRRQARRAAADLPYSADLLAAALRAGASPGAAARAVGEAVGGPLGDRLCLAGRTLALGAPASEAWAHLGPVPGAQRIAEAAVRSEHSGAALAGALSRLADDLRAARLTDADAASRRAGVLIVLPLGLCFLPAFVLAGLVPVIVAVLGDVLSH